MKKILLVARMAIRLRPLWTIGVFSVVAFALGGMTLNYIDARNYKNFSLQNLPERQTSGEYKFTSPLLDCNSFGGPFALRADSMKQKAEDIINQELGSKFLDHVSVYFRDLSNGPTMGIDEEEEFTPASLLKVPLLIAYFKKAETDPAILKEKITFTTPAGDAVNQNIKPSKQLKEGNEYEAEELIERMIINSDNESANLLLENIDQDFLNKTYTDLGIEIPGTSGSENFMTVKQYASFFRILYNASYLNRGMSEKALSLLSQSEYSNGLKVGIPGDVQIAHKFGERVLGSSFQLHDCGIIYKGSTPYILCLMSRGQDFSELERIIQSISRMVYQEVDKK
jgi:beta-lactamase class A